MKKGEFIMLKKNYGKIYITIGVIIAFLLILHLVGGSIMDIVKNHLGI